MQNATLLRFAMHALRDLDAGYPATEIACPPGVVDESVPQASGLLKLVGAIALRLAQIGALDDEDRRMVAGLLPDLEVPATASPDVGRKTVLNELVQEGLMVGGALTAFASEDDDPFVQAAREKYEYGSDGDVDIDANPPISESDEGAYVLGWLWVSKDDAGVETDDDDDASS